MHSLGPPSKGVKISKSSERGRSRSRSRSARVGDGIPSGVEGVAVAGGDGIPSGVEGVAVADADGVEGEAAKKKSSKVYGDGRGGDRSEKIAAVGKPKPQRGRDGGAEVCLWCWLTVTLVVAIVGAVGMLFFLVGPGRGEINSQSSAVEDLWGFTEGFTGGSAGGSSSSSSSASAASDPVTRRTLI
jgi:hypothetical protein